MEVLKIVVTDYSNKWLPEAEIEHIPTGWTQRGSGYIYIEAIQNALKILERRIELRRKETCESVESPKFAW